MNESVGVIILSPRQVATGSPAGWALENINTALVANGALCYVEEGAGQGEWQLQKEATDVPDGVTIVAPIAGPGRWFIKLFPGPGGGGGGGITALAGSGGITITNPVGPVATVVGTNLYARNGSNGAMTANVNMGGFTVTNAAGVSSTATLTLAGATGLVLNGGVPLDWPAADGTAGQAIVTDGAGNLSFATVGGGGGTPAAPNGSVQFNNAGAFGGSSLFLYSTPAAGFGPALNLRSSLNTDNGTGYYLRNSLGAIVGAYSFNDDPLSANWFTTISGAGVFQVDAFSGELQLKSTTDVLADIGGTALKLNATTVASVGAGKVLSWDGTQNAYVTPAAAPTIQNITAAGPTAITNTMYTIALVNFAGATAVTLPAHAAGKVIVVKDKSGAANVNNITISATSGTIDGAATQIIATIRGSMSFVSDGTDWWIF